MATVADLVLLDTESPWLAPEPVLSVAALVLGFLALSWQLDTQHKYALKADNASARDRLKLDIYRDIAKRIEATTAPLTHAGAMPFAFVGELTIRTQQAVVGPSRYRFSDFQEASMRASTSLFALMAVLEVYEIALPEFMVFRTELATASRQLGTALGDFLNSASLFTDPLVWPPTAAHSANMSRLAEVAQGASISASGIVWDLRVEAQNCLLGGLFPGQLASERTPGDPSVRVIRVRGGGE